MLEVGVKKGKSLMMWAEKFPCVAVVGMDIDVAKAHPGPYTVEYTDQASKPQLQSSIGECKRCSLLTEDLGCCITTHPFLCPSHSHLHPFPFLLIRPGSRTFDLIIDDGGHSMVQQQNTLDVYWSHVNRCGMFIMEDLQTSYQVYNL